MKTFFLFFIFFTVGVSKVMTQTPDVAISYILREVQIKLAKQYNKELNKSKSKFSEYTLINTGFYIATKTGSRTPSSFDIAFPTNPCWDPTNPLKMPLNPLKVRRCRQKIKLLRFADRLVRSSPLITTSYPTKNAVRSNIMVKTNSILRDINTQLLEH